MADPRAAAVARPPGRDEEDAQQAQQMHSLQEPAAKAMRTSGDSNAASLRHIQTEKRRRDRINEGYLALRELIPSKEKADKATILMQVVDYIRQMQAVMAQVLHHAPSGQLPEELQWSMRMLLPRESPALAFASTANTAALSTAAAPGNGNGGGAGAAASGASNGQGQYTAQQVALMQQQAQQQAGVEAYAPVSGALSVTDVNQLQALLSQQQAQQNPMAQNHVVQLLQLQAMLQAQQQPNGGQTMQGMQDSLRQYGQQGAQPHGQAVQGQTVQGQAIQPQQHPSPVHGQPVGTPTPGNQ